MSQRTARIILAILLVSGITTVAIVAPLALAVIGIAIALIIMAFGLVLLIEKAIGG